MTKDTWRRARVGIVGCASLALLTLPSPAYATDEADVAAALSRMSAGTNTQADCDLVAQNAPEIAATVPCIVNGNQVFKLGSQPLDPKEESAVLDYRINALGEYEIPDTLLTADEAKAVVLDFIGGGDASNADEVIVPEEPEGGLSSPEEFSTRAATGTWRATHVTYTNYSYTGSVIYKYHHKANFQYSGGKVRAWGSRSDYTSNESSVVDVQNRLTNTKTSLPASTAYSTMKRKIVLKVPIYGEYASNYPWIKIKMTGSGGTSFTGAAL
ncbi:hypothetical protein [Streptomyces sp. NPDC060366]|uniref:hypothetical protein n=1 Tax=Streptomyces sp. NPDC060366 TaxID=3347105 RepID=UPI00364A97CF